MFCNTLYRLIENTTGWIPSKHQNGGRDRNNYYSTGYFISRTFVSVKWGWRNIGGGLYFHAAHQLYDVWAVTNTRVYESVVLMHWRWITCGVQSAYENASISFLIVEGWGAVCKVLHILPITPGHKYRGLNSFVCPQWPIKLRGYINIQTAFRTTPLRFCGFGSLKLRLSRWSLALTEWNVRSRRYEVQVLISIILNKRNCKNTLSHLSGIFPLSQHTPDEGNSLRNVVWFYDHLKLTN